MQVIICYDISDNKLRYRMVKYLEKIAIRTQKSVFKADLNDRDITKLNRFADRLLKNGALGNLQIYKTQQNCSNHSSAELPKQYIII